MAAATVVTVGVAATALHAAPPVRRSVALTAAAGAVTVYLGGPDVTAATGWPAALPMSIDVDPHEVLYAAVAAGSQDVNVLVQGG